ncbi:MAG: hypothetical protein HC880_15390, partial [Bacteroidia bacterium]|nr:hypothetical protein [Bacteroidia bacterium]
MDIWLTIPEQSDNIRKFRIEVQDTGIGISLDQQEKIFTNFYQADASFSRKFGGSGLGLAISQKIVEAMRGKI